jgi:hypothetical protein
MSIWLTQQVHEAACKVLALYVHVTAAVATHAFVDVSIRGQGTTGALMVLEDGEWRIDRLYMAEHPLPGAVGVVVWGTW